MSFGGHVRGPVGDRGHRLRSVSPPPASTATPRRCRFAGRRRLIRRLGRRGPLLLRFVALLRLFRFLHRAAPFAPVDGVGGWNRCLGNLSPVESDARVQLLERPTRLVVERIATDFDVGRRPKCVKDARPRVPAALLWLDQRKELVAPLVSRESQKSQNGRQR